MLNNLFKVKAKNFWHHLLHAYADVISFLLQGNVKSKKMTKIAKIKEKKMSISSEWPDEFKGNFQENATYETRTPPSR